jgi:nicotinamidase-related amidase
LQFPDTIIQRVRARQGTLHPYTTLDASHTAFVVVDLQNYYTQPEYQGHCQAAKHTFPAVNRLASALRSAGGRVIWIQTCADGAQTSWSHHHQTMLTPERSERRLRELGANHEAYKIASGLDVDEGDIQIVKRCYSALAPGSSSLHETLAVEQIKMVLIGGTATNVCCESTARDAMMMDYPTIMVHDALSSFTEEEHVNALHNWMLYFGDVLGVEDVIERLV